MIWQSHMAQSGEWSWSQDVARFNPCSLGHCSHNPCEGLASQRVYPSQDESVFFASIPAFLHLKRFLPISPSFGKSWSRVGPICQRSCWVCIVCWNSLYRQWKMFPAGIGRSPGPRNQGDDRTLHRNDGITWYNTFEQIATWNKSLAI